VTGLPQREDALLGPRPLLVAPGAADRRVEPAGIERLAQRDRLHDPGVLVRAVAERRHPIGVRVHPQVEPQPPGRVVPEGDHLPELPAGVDVQHGQRHPAWSEGLGRQVQQHRGVLADRVQQHRPAKRTGDLAQDVDRLCLEDVQDVFGRDRHGLTTTESRQS
jgi:hypothetical protein